MLFKDRIKKARATVRKSVCDVVDIDGISFLIFSSIPQDDYQEYLTNEFKFYIDVEQLEEHQVEPHWFEKKRLEYNGDNFVIQTIETLYDRVVLTLIKDN